MDDETPALLRHPLALALGSGAVQGALLLGSVISLLHVLHDRLPSVWDALVLFAFSNLAYGLWCGLSLLVVVAVLRAGGRLLRRRRAEAAGDESGSLRKRRARELTVAGFAFYLVFFFLLANYGLTYDEAPLGPDAGAWAMLAYLAARTVGAALLAALLARVLARVAVAGTERRSVPVLLAAAWIGLLTAHLVAAARFEPPEPPPPADVDALPTAAEDAGYDVVLVGLDGADWRVIEPLVEAGEMPHMARLMEEGAWGPLATLPDANSAVLWASIYTGKTPRQHGVLDFYSIRVAGMTGDGVYPVHRTFFKEIAGAVERFGGTVRRTVDRSDLRAPLLWEIAGALGKTVGVVDGYYYSYPAPPLGSPESFFVAYGADRFARRVEGRPLDRVPVQRIEEVVRPPEIFPEIAPLLAAGEEFDWQAATLLDRLERRPAPGLVSFYAHQPDAVQHWSWRRYEPEKYLGAPPEEPGGEADRIAAFHRKLDAFLGRLTERLDERTVLMIVSDHGHSPTIFHAMDTQHRHGPPGIVLLHGPPVRAAARLDDAHVYDVFPTVLRLLALPVPDDAAGTVMDGALAQELPRLGPVDTVSTYGSLGMPPGAGPAADEDRRREELEKLRALGYIQ